jgi:uroporphyrinogen decarboxylase
VTSRERVLSCLARKGYDRLPVRYHAVAPVHEQVRERLGLVSGDEVEAALGVDFRWIDSEYRGPELRKFPDGTTEGLWGERWSTVHNKDGVFQDIVYQPYAGITDVAQLKGRREPTLKWCDASNVPGDCRQHDAFALYAGGAGHMDFLNGIGRLRGQEQVLLDVATEDPVFLELAERRFQYFYAKVQRVLEAAQGRIDIVWSGEDLGTQTGPILSPDTFFRLFGPKYRAYYELAHRHGARTATHVCGAIRAFIPRLIDLGLDILDVVQVSAAGMDLERLRDDFGKDLTFCGTMCVQTVLPHGTVRDVEAEVRRRQELFPDGGLILGPTNTIEIGTPVENVVAMYRAAGSLREG